MIVSGKEDAAQGTRYVAAEFGLTFINLGWESLDFAARRDVHFGMLFQKFLEQLRAPEILKQAKQLGGYEILEK